MFEQFTDRSREVMALANQDAVGRRHPQIGPEQILQGLVKAGTGVGADVLKSLVGGKRTAVAGELEK
jgi:ATP-dependent Clp protease ATP-binding subunit ClpC